MLNMILHIKRRTIGVLSIAVIIFLIIWLYIISNDQSYKFQTIALVSIKNGYLRISRLIVNLKIIGFTNWRMLNR